MGRAGARAPGGPSSAGIAAEPGAAGRGSGREESAGPAPGGPGRFAFVAGAGRACSPSPAPPRDPGSRAAFVRAPPLLNIHAAPRTPPPRPGSRRERASARFSCRRRKGGAVGSPQNLFSVSRFSSSPPPPPPAPRLAPASASASWSSLSGGLALRAPLSAAPRPLLRAARAGARRGAGPGPEARATPGGLPAAPAME